MSLGAFLAFYPTLMLEEYDISLRLSGGILALGVITGGVGGLAIAWAASTTRREGNFLQCLGILMIATNIGMILNGSVPALFILSFFNGVAWAFFPILVTVPFHLPRIRPRELAVAFAFTMDIFGAAVHRDNPRGIWQPKNRSFHDQLHIDKPDHSWYYFEFQIPANGILSRYTLLQNPIFFQRLVLFLGQSNQIL